MSLAIGMILSSIGVTLFLLWARRPKDTQTPNTMKYPKFYASIGAFGMLSVITALFLCSIQGFGKNLPAEIFVITSTLLLFMCFTWLFVHSRNWELTVSEEGLIYKNLFGRKRKYSYSDITRITACYLKGRKELHKYKIYVSNKKITVEGITENFFTFEKRIKRMLKKAKNPLEIEITFLKF